jgi:hypothetical protein
MIPKSQDAVAVRFEKRAANLIFGGLAGMLAAIDFDDQFSLNRAEIRRSTDRRDVGGGISRCTCVWFADNARGPARQEFARGAIRERFREMLRTRAFQEFCNSAEKNEARREPEYLIAREAALRRERGRAEPRFASPTRRKFNVQIPSFQ